MKTKGQKVLRAILLSFFLLASAVQQASAEISAKPLDPPFNLKISLDHDQYLDITHNNDPVRLSWMLGYVDTMIISIEKNGQVTGWAAVKVETSTGDRTTTGVFNLTGVYQSGKIIGTWTYTGKLDIPQAPEFYFIADQTFEGSGDFYSTGTIDKNGGKGYMSGEMTWTHEECDQQDKDTRSPTFGQCLKKSTHVDTESFEIQWTGQISGTYCFMLRVKNDWGDSLARFNAITGQVETTCDPEFLEGHLWEPASMNQVIYVGDHIATRNNSSAILQFADMNTYTMSPNTEIVIETPPEQETKLKLVMGRLWNNTKKLLFEGTMEIETSQAVLGIKGTTLVLETDGTTTTLKVIAGDVEFTSKTTGESIMVSTGQQASADSNGLSGITPFDIAAETNSWLPYVEDPSILEPSTGVEHLPKDYYQNTPEVATEKQPGSLRNIWDKTLGRICSSICIFPGLLSIVLMFRAKKTFAIRKEQK